MRIAEIAFSHHPKRADGCERPALVNVQFVPVIAVQHDLPLESARQFEAFEKCVSRIVVSSASVPIALTNVATFASIVWFAITSRLMTQFDPRHLDVAGVVIAIAGSTSNMDSLIGREQDRDYRDDENDYARS
jgi:hypothetical protein